MPRDQRLISRARRVLHRQGQTSGSRGMLRHRGPTMTRRLFAAWVLMLPLSLVLSGCSPDPGSRASLSPGKANSAPGSPAPGSPAQASPAPGSPAPGQPPAATVVYLVRHAEKARVPPGDPDLTPAGESRSRVLASLLADVPLAGIYASDYRRTRLTAAPTSEQHGVPVTLYDPRPEGLQALARGLAGKSGHFLVVGHSNTTPALVELLGGDPLGTIDESEYDRLYLVTRVPGSTVSTVLLRYPGGPSSVGEQTP